MQNFKDFDPSTGLTRKDIGLVYSRQPVQVVFQKEPNSKAIVNMQADCGCSKPIDQGDILIINYVPGDVPEGAVMAWNAQSEATRTPRPSHMVEKGVTITFFDQTSERIFFKAVVSMP